MGARPQLWLSFAKKLTLSQWVFLLVLLFATFTRLWRLELPQTYYFDEVYHVVTAKLMAQNNPAAYEWWHPAPEPNTAIDWLHPPLAKLLQAGTIVVLGNSSFSWRLSSAVFGVATIALVFFVARRLGFSEKTATLAALLLSLDGLALTMSRITMNDAHVSFFFLLTAYTYLGWKKHTSWKNALLVTASAGLAVASKWSGVFVLACIFADVIREYLRADVPRVPSLGATLRLGICLLVGVPLLYLASYGQMFLQGKGFDHLVGLHQQIWWYQTNLKATHPYQSKPWQWVLNLRPVYAYTENVDADTLKNVYFQGNPLFLWAGALSALWIGLDAGGLFVNQVALLRRTLHAESKISAENLRRAWKKLQSSLPWIDGQMFLLIAYLSTWAAWTFSPRIMFFYHYTPALPFLALMLASLLGPTLTKGSRFRVVSVLVIGSIAFTFIVFFANWTGLAVPVDPFAVIYFLLPNWR